MARRIITTDPKKPHPRRHKAAPGECKTCDAERQAHSDFHPSHDASPRCESGHRAHCSCDICF